MNFAIPRGNTLEMVFHIWKIIELPSIQQDDLLRKISFELFLFSPKEAKEFINMAIHKGYLILEGDVRIKLSESLALELNKWHEKRKTHISEKIKDVNDLKEFTNESKNNGINKFNLLLIALLDKGTINRAVAESDSAYKFGLIDSAQKIIKAEVQGSQKIPYNIDINISEKVIKHNCHDFRTKRAVNKKFCKHLAKLFLLLKSKNADLASYFLESITKDINNWKFLS
ncbi:MAG TPA: hypothetical protein VMV43_09700 [Candidatus Nanopelagicaceae bacterium]|nr:hypothetical protein [Candidatus Nanopelagicaceae bacterium]